MIWRRTVHPVLVAALLSSTLTVAACNRYAKIETGDGVVHRVDLRASDAATLHGVTPDDTRVSIARGEVVDTTLPGNVGIPVFATLTGVSAIACGGAAWVWQAENEDAAVIGVIVFGLTTLGAAAPLVWYAVQRSEDADILEGNVSPSISVAPTAVRERGGDHRPGVAMTVTF